MKSILTVALAVTLITIALVSPAKAQSVTILSPLDIRAAYDLNPLLQSGYTGKGVTVAVVNSGIDKTFYSDLTFFSNKYGLPAPVTVVAQPDGSAGTDIESPTAETTFDAEYVHAMAPDAKILLVLTGTHTYLDGFSYVIDNNAADIATLSPSWYQWGQGASDFVQSYNDEYAKSVGENITLIASSQDWGSNNSVPWGWVSGVFWTKHLPNSYLMPQYSPYVTAVGGTVLTMQSGTYVSETGWNQSGGGPSNLFREPSWQTGPGVPQNGFRNIPDISLDASCTTPYAFDWNADYYTWFCGTSAGAPTFAGIMADIDQAAGGRVGFLNPLLYSLATSDPSVYHDVTSGCSVVEAYYGAPVKTGYCASAGWNFVTGWGSIDAAKLAAHLAPSAHMVPEFPVGAAIPFSLILVPVLFAARKHGKMKNDQGYPNANLKDSVFHCDKKSAHRLRHVTAH